MIKLLAKFELELKDVVIERVKGHLASATNSFSDFGSISKKLSGRQLAGDNLL